VSGKSRIAGGSGVGRDDSVLSRSVRIARVRLVGLTRLVKVRPPITLQICKRASAKHGGKSDLIQNAGVTIKARTVGIPTPFISCPRCITRANGGTRTSAVSLFVGYAVSDDVLR